MQVLFRVIYSAHTLRIDDEIFEHLSAAFPEALEEPYSKLTNIDEDWMKSDSGKRRWREYMMQYVPLLPYFRAVSHTADGL